MSGCMESDESDFELSSAPTNAQLQPIKRANVRAVGMPMIIGISAFALVCACLCIIIFKKRRRRWLQARDYSIVRNYGDQLPFDEDLESGDQVTVVKKGLMFGRNTVLALGVDDPQLV